MEDQIQILKSESEKQLEVIRILEAENTKLKEQVYIYEVALGEEGSDRDGMSTNTAVSSDPRVALASAHFTIKELRLRIGQLEEAVLNNLLENDRLEIQHSMEVSRSKVMEISTDRSAQREKLAMDLLDERDETIRRLELALKSMERRLFRATSGNASS